MANDRQWRDAVLALAGEFEGKALLCRQQAGDFLSGEDVGEDASDWAIARVAQGGAWEVAAQDLRALMEREAHDA